MSFAELFKFWPLVIAFVGIVAWAIRLEYLSKNNEKDIVGLKERVTSIEKSADTFREEIKLDMARIITSFEYVQKEVSEMKRMVEKIIEKIT